MLTAGLGNTSFVGFPLLESYLGKEALGFGIISDQFGTFLALSIPGIILASVAEKGDWDFKFLIQRMIRFAPMYALVFAFLLRPIEYSDDLKILFIRLGDTLSPLALVSVGYLLDIKHFKGYEKVICIGMIFKLVFSPLLIYVLFKPFDLNTLMFQTTVLEAGMAPMVTSSIVAIEKEIEPQLAAIMLGFGIPLSFFTTGIIYFFMIGT
jgi:predicted permease